MSDASLPSGCLLDRHVRVDGDEDDEDDLIAGEEPFSILSCVDKQALGFHGHEAYEADEAIRSLDLGAHFAGEPPGLSCLVLRGGSPCTIISDVDRNVMVFITTLPSLNRAVYLVYDAIAGSLRMTPLLRDSSSRVALTSRMLIARPGPARGHGGGEYALALTGKLAVADEDGGRRRERNSLFLWRPSSSSRPWSEAKTARFPDDVDEKVYQADEVFSLDGHGYWGDLLCGVMHCSCDALFDDTRDGDGDDEVEFGFIPLPVEPGGHHRNGERVAQPVAYRTMGVVQDSIIRFVSISGFLEHVELKDRTVTVWRLLGHGDMGWEKEHELRLDTVWGLEGFGDMSKALTPMYPLLSSDDEDVVYFALGEYYENRRKGKFVPTGASYLVGVDMRRQILLGSVRLPCRSGRTDTPDLVSCGFSRYLRTLDPFAFDDEEAP